MNFRVAVMQQLLPVILPGNQCLHSEALSETGTGENRIIIEVPDKLKTDAYQEESIIHFYAAIRRLFASSFTQ